MLLLSAARWFMLVAFVLAFPDAMFNIMFSAAAVPTVALVLGLPPSNSLLSMKGVLSSDPFYSVFL